MYVMTRDEAKRAARHWAQVNPANRRLTEDERTRVWLQSLDPRAIDHIAVWPEFYVSKSGHRAKRSEMTVFQFARSLYPHGGVLKRIPNVNLEACYLVLPTENIKEAN